MQNGDKKTRKRVNFTIKIPLLHELDVLVPNGERSDFINEALEEALVRLSRKKAGEMTDKLRKKLRLKIQSDEALLKDIRYGRKEW